MGRSGVSRRAVLRRLGSGAGAVAFLPWLSREGQAVFADLQGARATPALRVLSPAQHATLEVLVEDIIPTDERSPGAREARVADYFDLLLSEAAEAPRQEWLEGLAALDAEAASRFGAPFVRLSDAQRDAILADISRNETAKPQPPAAPPATPPTSPPAPPPAGAPSAKPLEGSAKARTALVVSLTGEVSRADQVVPRPRLEAFFLVTKRATIQGYYTSEIGIHRELRYKGNRVVGEFVGCLTLEGKDCPHCGQKAEGGRVG
jgi:hypothetical protein